MDPQSAPDRPKGRKNLTNDQRQQILALLLQETDKGKLRHGAIQNVAKILTAKSLEQELPSVSHFQVSRVWQRACESFRTSNTYDVSSRKHLAGRPPKYTKDMIQERIRAVPPNQRKGLRSLSEQIGVPVSSLHNCKERGWLMPVDASEARKMMNKTKRTLPPACAENVPNDIVSDCE